MTEFLASLPPPKRCLGIWSFARPPAPAAARAGAPWRTWLILGGRGAGKTRAGAEWVRACARRSPIAASARPHRAGRRDRARRARGDDRGRVRAARGRTPRPSGRTGSRRAAALEWPNGAVAQAFSAEDPGQPARAAVRRRLVRRARQVAPCRSRPSTCCSSGCGLARGRARSITTTPRPIPLIKRLIADPGDRASRAPAPPTTPSNLAPAFLETIVGALRRHAARPPGARRRDHRGPRRRAVDARAAIEAAASRRRRRSRASWSRSIRRRRRAQRRRRLRHRRGRASAATASVYVLADATRAGCRPPAGRARRSRCRRLEADCARRRGQPGRRHGARRDPRASTRACR